MKFKNQIPTALCCLSLALIGQVSPVMAQTATEDKSPGSTASQKDLKNASEEVAGSAKVIQKMQSEESLNKALQQAKGIFVVPKYGRAALGVGGKGGEGIVLLKQDNKWGDPAFYNFGGVSAGLQAGVEGGSLAFILTNDKAVRNFMKDHNFSLNADAGLTVVDWSTKGQADLGKADVIAWSDTKGLFGSAAIGIQDVKFDSEETHVFYGKKVSLNDIVSGKAKAPQQKVSDIQTVLSSDSASLSGGASSGKDKEEEKLNK